MNCQGCINKVRKVLQKVEGKVDFFSLFQSSIFISKNHSIKIMYKLLMSYSIYVVTIHNTTCKKKWEEKKKSCNKIGAIVSYTLIITSCTSHYISKSPFWNVNLYSGMEFLESNRCPMQQEYRYKCLKYVTKNIMDW